MATPTRMAAAGLPLTEQCIYVYGIVDSSVQPGMLIGAARGPELDMTTVGSVAAVHCRIGTSEMTDLEPEIVEGSRFAQLVRRHDEVVTALSLAAPVLPVRFGTLLADRDRVAEALADGERQLSAALDRVRGCAEWQLRVTPPPSDVDDDQAAPITDASAGLSDLSRPGTSYLLGKREARRRAIDRHSQLVDAVYALDTSLSEQAQESGGPALSGASGSRAYLVAHSAQGDFLTACDHAVAALEHLGCTVTLHGPLAAYSFTDVRLGGARHA
jgi:Gas vesicle synthesis protein GvpL/GvpF